MAPIGPNAWYQSPSGAKQAVSLPFYRSTNALGFSKSNEQLLKFDGTLG